MSYKLAFSTGGSTLGSVEEFFLSIAGDRLDRGNVLHFPPALPLDPSTTYHVTAYQRRAFQMVGEGLKSRKGHDQRGPLWFQFASVSRKPSCLD